MHASMGVAEGTGRSIRDVGRFASALAPVKDDLFRSPHLDPWVFPHVAEDYQGGKDCGNRQQPPPQDASPDDKGSSWI